MLQCLKNAYGEFDATHSVGPAKWNWYDLLVVHSGRLKLRVGKAQSTVELEEANAILLYPKTHFQGHAVTPSAKAAAHHFRYPSGFCIANLPRKSDGYRIFKPHSFRQIAEDLDRVIRAERNQPGHNAALFRSAMMTAVIAQLTAEDAESPRSESHCSEEFRECLDRFRSNLHRPMCIADLAEIAGFSETHFRRKFREEFDVPVGMYLRSIRMTEAQRLLSETRLGLKRCATHVGYDELAHFCRAFKRHFGFTPTQYRQKHALRG